MKKSTDFPWRFGLFLATYYLANAVYQGYAAKYFEAVGMTHTQLTILLAMAPIISVVMQPVWGMLGDRSKSRNAVLRVLIIAAAGIVLTYRISNAFWWLMISSLLFQPYLLR